VKKLLLLACVSALVLCGCATGGSLAKVVKELKNDPATVNVRITSIYGSIFFTRTAPTTNSLPHVVGSDGTVTVGQTK
jgi:uncharacterized protein with ACT and thioredoxin-like domain